MSVRLLDCTLRDGGYVNNWEFGRHTMAAILDKLDRAGIEIIECGFLTNRPRDGDCSMFGGPEAVLPLLPQRESQAMYVAMIAMGEKELPPSKLPPCGKTGITGIRLTFHREQADLAFAWAGAIMDKGYKVFLQPVGTAFYPDLELLRLVERVNRLKPYAFYIVDTLGSMYRGQLARQYHLIDGNMDPEVQLGYHGHNNLQLAFSNAQALSSLQTKRELILDCSVYGMGRGAGNLPTELAARYINQNIDARYRVGEVLDIYDEYIAPLRREYEWGYTMAYHIAASHSCHPNYAAYLMNKQTLTMQDIESVLQSIPQENRVEFDRDLIRRLYAYYQTRSIDDSHALEELRDLLGGRQPLVLGAGALPSGDLRDLLRRQSPPVLSVGPADPRLQVQVCFLSNHKQLDIAGGRMGELGGARRVYTSNLAAYGTGDCLFVDYGKCLLPDPMVGDDSGLMLLRLLERCGVKRTWFCAGTPPTWGGLAARAELLERRRRVEEQLRELHVEVEFLQPVRERGDVL